VLRVFGDGLYRPLDFDLEIEPKAPSSLVVIRHRLQKLYFRFMDDRDACHEWLALISAKTSAAGRPEAVPSRTMLSRR
jgi:hypothetical protein